MTMTAELSTPAVPAARRSAHHRPEAVVAALTGRLIRRGAAVLTVSIGAYLVVEVTAFQAAYPTAESRAGVAKLADNPAIRMLQGVPHAIGTSGGYVVWDAGWLIQSIVALWAVAVVTRLLRGEEDVDRAALVLTGPVTAQRLTGAQLAVVAAALVTVGTTCAMALLLCGTPAAGALVYAGALVAFAGVFAGTAALAAQVAGTRRRAMALSSGALTAAYLVRMVANSTDARGWMRWLTPYGWVDETRAYDTNRWWVPAALGLIAVGIGTAAVLLRAHRDAGAALVAGHGRTRSRLGFLSGPTALAWRLNAPVLAGWMAGLAAYSVMIGALAPAVTQIRREDADYRRLFDNLGMGFAASDRGFVALMGPSLALVIALYACWRIGAARAEEAAGHVDVLLARPLTRRQWLLGHGLLTLLGAAILTLGSALAVWLGALIAGADVSLLDALAAVAAPLPVTVAFTGVALLLLSVLPRLTTGLPAALVVVAYLLNFLGQGLHLPGWVVAVSPFDHLGYVPVQPLHLPAMVALIAAGAVLATAAAAIFDRRDVAGA
jgi:ABC-2 type transport system permease protein